ncbi:MAG: hypothetical protein WHV67_10375 [Thermoanaerobaculia bacterium]
MDIKVPRIKVPCKVFVHHSGEEDCEVFLAEASSFKPGVETFDEFLNIDKREFVPIKLAYSGRVILMSKKFIETISVSPEIIFVDKNEGTPPTREVEVEVQMEDGRIYKGKIKIFGGLYESRVIDFINQGGTFFQLHSEKLVHYINKNFLKKIEEV